MDDIGVKRTIRAGVLVAAIAVGLTACGGAGSTSSDATGSRAAGYARLVAYARCMRSHGVPNYPDPVSNGSGIGMSTTGLDPTSPQVESAARACRSLAPPGPTAAQQAQSLARELNFSRCMRSHGVPNYPDPSPSGALSLNGSAVDKGSPQFRRAYQACRSDLGGGGPLQQVAGGP